MDVIDKKNKDQLEGPNSDSANKKAKRRANRNKRQKKPKCANGACDKKQKKKMDKLKKKCNLNSSSTKCKDIKFLYMDTH